MVGREGSVIRREGSVIRSGYQLGSSSLALERVLARCMRGGWSSATNLKRWVFLYSMQACLLVILPSRRRQRRQRSLRNQWQKSRKAALQGARWGGSWGWELKSSGRWLGPVTISTFFWQQLLQTSQSQRCWSASLRASPSQFRPTNSRITFFVMQPQMFLSQSHRFFTFSFRIFRNTRSDPSSARSGRSAARWLRMMLWVSWAGGTSQTRERSGTSPVCGRSLPMKESADLLREKLRKSACWSAFICEESPRSMFSPDSPSFSPASSSAASPFAPGHIFFMFITQGPYHQKRNFKFSHRLAGQTYNNDTYLEHSRLPTRPTSALPSQPPAKPRHTQSASQPRSFFEGANRTDEPDRRQQPALRKKSAAVGSQLTTTKRGSLVETACTNNRAARENLRKQSGQPQRELFEFGGIELRMIDKVGSLRDIAERSITVSLEKVFKRMISTQLMGEFTARFMRVVETHIRSIVKLGELEREPCLPHHLRSVSRKQELLELIGELELGGQAELVREVVQKYCLPAVSASQDMLAQLLEDLRIEIYEKKSCNRDIDYALLDHTCRPIQHIAQLYFSTRILLIAPTDSLQKTVANYQMLLEEHDKSLRLTFRDGLKHHFVEKVVQKMIDEQPQVELGGRREIVEHAEELLESRSKVRLSSKRFKQQELPADIAVDLEFPTACSFLMRGYLQRKRREGREYRGIIAKLATMLNPNKKYGGLSRADEQTEEEFRSLHMLNDSYDITYNHSADHSRCLLFPNFAENWPVLARKNKAQTAAILQLVRDLYAERQPMKELQFWQFKELAEAARGVAATPVLTKVVLGYMKFDEFGEVSRQQFDGLMTAAIAQEGRTLRLSKDILWNWLQRLKLVENQALRSHQLQIWYEPVQVVFLLFLSIIFGDSHAQLFPLLR